MAKNLVIVESPAKSKTIRKYLGNDFEVLASYGHVRDLPSKKGAVLPETHFAMHYELIEKNKKYVDAITKAGKAAQAIYLATDPDREGEAISWHILEILKAKKALSKQTVHRVVFYEVTKKAILEAMAHPRDISMDLVNAQQARRALDYLVGFNLSPLLWQKVRRGLSAGRVQSPALRLIVERETEIEAFKTQEYWTIEGEASKDRYPFAIKLAVLDNKPLKQFDIVTALQSEAITQDILAQAQGSLTVSHVETKQRKRQPSAPFITSTLQQEAVRKLNLNTKRTMQIAQQLYEGIDTGEGLTGLITYMRTDSVTLAQEAVHDIRNFINEHYGQDNVPAAPRQFKTKAKNAQEAHEAIRPTSIYRTPESLKTALTPEQFKLYQLIWKRTLASQMSEALIDGTSVDFPCARQGLLRATGSVIVKPGFLRVYQESLDDSKEEESGLLPALAVGDQVKLATLAGLQHFTEPPPRYSEASLVKVLEEYGIGRPSTYASIIGTLQTRDYVTLENKRFHPTDIGRVVNKFLTEYFAKYVDYGFTATLEDDLDAVSRGESVWLPLLAKFWEPFKSQIDHITKSVTRQDVTQELLDEACPQCNKPLSLRLGRNGKFIGCTGYPECTYTRPLEAKAGEEAIPATQKVDRACPDCGGDLVIKQGRYGQFIGCANYPTCKHIEKLHQPQSTGVACPQCQQGELLAKKSRYGKLFYACNRYPNCKYALWYPPLKEPCPKCGWPIMMLKETKRKGQEKVCPEESCKHSEAATNE